MIRIDGLSKKFHSTSEQAAVDDVSLEIREGTLFTLLGPSGCGKTTTLRCIAGLEQPDLGEIYIEDTLVFSNRRGVNILPYRRRIGMVFQSYAVWPHMTVYQNVAYPLKNLRQNRGEIDKAVAWVLQLVGLGHLAERPAPLLSGGEQQRVALARALVENPKVLLLDEPLSNLDAKLREQMRLELRDLQQRLGLTTIYVTHDQEEAFSLSDVMALMNGGKLVEIGHPEELYQVPQTIFGAEFLGGGTKISGRVIGSESGDRLRVRTVIGELVCRCRSGAPEGSRVEVYVRPEDVHVVANDTLAQEQTMEAKIKRVTFLGGIIEWWAETKGVGMRGRSLANSKESQIIQQRINMTTPISVGMTRCVVSRPG